MKKIKIAQIGTGHDHAFSPIPTFKKLSDIFEFVGYCTVPEDEYNIPQFGNQAHKWAIGDAKQLTLDEILNYPDLDAVCIETEDRALTKYAIMAAEKGLHIQMDKPGGIDDAEFDRLIDIVEEKKLVFHMAYMYRYNPAVIKLKEDIKAGKLGDIISAEGEMDCRHALPKRNWLKAYPGGMLYFLGCHMVDLVYSIMGDPEEIIPLSCSSGLEGTDAKDFGMAVFKYKNGVSVAKSTAVEDGGYERRHLLVVGTKGTVELRPIETGAESTEIFNAQKTTVRENFSEAFTSKAECYETEVFGRFDGMFRAFADYINGVKSNPYTYEYERKLHKILLKACGEKV
ncbi:MAG: Gfo/Idh/MocA family oxidoreductase [Acutalibacteraceae bacterium]|nr:Gfo/Idh/MocA family oxidoreductase [Acutalibacteraceae bacterium]